MIIDGSTQAQMGQPGGSVMLDADAQARAQAILRSLCAPQGRNVLGGPGGLSEAHLAGLLAGNVDAAQLVNSIVNGAVMPGLPAAGQRPLNRYDSPILQQSWPKLSLSLLQG